MQLKVVRTTFTNRSTIGELFVDDALECFTLEDMVRPVKVPGMTAIPEGVYVVSVSFSNRFRRLLPEIHNVPNYTGVRIHPGNTDADTEGCILVGKTKAKDFVGNSRAAFDQLFARIQEAARNEKIFIEVTSAAPAARGLGARAAASRGLVAISPTPARLALVKPAAGRKAAARRTARPKILAGVKKLKQPTNPKKLKKPKNLKRPKNPKKPGALRLPAAARPKRPAATKRKASAAAAKRQQKTKPIRVR